MDKLYYINHDRFEKGDTRKALSFALSLVKQDPNIDTVTLLVLQTMQYAPFIIEELNLTKKQCEAHILPLDEKGRKLQIHTVNTYHPTNCFAGHEDCELLIAVGVPQHHLEQFIDCRRVKYWIIAPWLIEENRSMLNIFNAIDIETGELIQPNFQIDTRLVGAAKWLLDTSYPNEGYHHPLDENRLKEMANAIAHYNVPIDRDAFINHCVYNGFLYDAAKKTADYFIEAKGRMFVTRHSYNLAFLKEAMEKN